MTTGDLEEVKQSLDHWVKEINTKLTNMEKLTRFTKEVYESNEQNYILIQDLKEYIEQIRTDIKLMKHIQVIMLNMIKKKERIPPRCNI